MIHREQFRQKASLNTMQVTLYKSVSLIHKYELQQKAFGTSFKETLNNDITKLIKLINV